MADRRWLLPPLLVGLAALAAAGWDRELLQYQREAISAGAWWRLLSAHLTHLNPTHLLLNLLGLALSWALVGRRLSPRRWLLALPLLALGVGLGLWLFSPEIAWYVGLSGVLHGVLVLGALAGLRQEPLESGALLALVLAKLAWEGWSGAMSTAWVGPVVVRAHLYGAMSALALFPLFAFKRNPQPPLKR